MTLTDFARDLIPTPTTSDAKGPSPSHGGTTAEAIDRLLPTPVANDDHKKPAAHVAAKVRSGAGAVITSLEVMTAQYTETGEWSKDLLPTPRTSDSNGGGRHGDGGLDLRTAIADTAGTRPQGRAWSELQHGVATKEHQ